ncbi:hypothetical protein TrLO_g15078 [Triparma laevis f. longispina]|uniref:Cyclin-dependent kinase 2 homolog n=1 Tax=Triparma laevis f. longispina TaxID=1714387 RepID=A0A9W7E4X2_9STRA|nr:hypothetical protein TrLO_g15078 [Triparma laevis f. longispina]
MSEEASYVPKYRRLEVLGEGAYGVVYKGSNNATNEVVAIKKIRLYGVPRAVIREISLLRELIHPNVVKLLDVVNDTERLLLVFEFVQMDLKAYLDLIQPVGSNRRVGVPLNKLSSLMRQMVAGVAFCHERRILHRDIKPHNILITGDGRLKLADFGLARLLSFPARIYTREVVTLWYRAPELLFGSLTYGAAVDGWSVGCIFAEMATGIPLFPGQSEIDQIFRIMQKLGTPTAEVWPELETLPHFQPVFPNWPGASFEFLTSNHLPPLAVSLLCSLLRYDPTKRISCTDALHHGYLASVDPEYTFDIPSIRRTVTEEKESP